MDQPIDMYILLEIRTNIMINQNLEVNSNGTQECLYYFSWLECFVLPSTLKDSLFNVEMGLPTQEFTHFPSIWINYKKTDMIQFRHFIPYLVPVYPLESVVSHCQPPC